MGLSKSVLSRFSRLADAKPVAEDRRMYCRSCGTLIPYDAVYCPHCGALQEARQLAAPGATRPTRGAAVEIIRSKRRIRLTLFIVSLTILITVFILGSMAPLSRQDAQAIVNDFQSTIGTSPTASQIFVNNAIITIQSFIPVLGIVNMAQTSYYSGLVYSAIVTVTPSSPSPLALDFATFLFPWTWLEFAAYSLASSEGLMIIVAAITRSLRREVRRLLITIAIAMALLAIGAFIEELAISSAMAG
jgi:hypothetical protein